ncbi:MAG: transcriptional repressor [Candidatus Krumholzibacteria bacterium]|nr:transcriptional repressor [Candidatus Krumholzibacteria bacterium]
MPRKTQQRNAVQRVLADANRPLSAQEVFEAAQDFATGLGIATVYRNLKMMVREKRLVLVSLAGEPNRYELAGKAHHHHFHCRDCNRVFEVPECTSDLRRMTPDGFLLDSHDLVLYGKCRECAG